MSRPGQRRQSVAAERLPAGRHGLAREFVLESQRGRMLRAMADSVAEKGYATTTVSDVVARAAVSRRTYYEQFADKEECFLAMYDAALELLDHRTRAAIAEEELSDWRAIARASIETVTRTLAEEPSLAVALIIEAIGAGSAALDRRAQFMDRFAEMWRRLYERARQEDPSLPPLPKALFRAIIGSQDEMMRDVVRLEGVAALPRHTARIWRMSMELLGARR